MTKLIEQLQNKTAHQVTVASHSKTGIVKGKKGSCYEINIKDGKKEKILIIHPVHLKRV